VHINIVARTSKTRAGKSAAGFFSFIILKRAFRLREQPANAVIQVSRRFGCFAAGIRNYDCQKKDLTRRANQRYIIIIAGIQEPVAEELAAGFLLAGARERAGTRRGRWSTFARGPSTPIQDHTVARSFDRAGNDDPSIAREG
jgi:hypothetical protein